MSTAALQRPPAVGAVAPEGPRCADCRATALATTAAMLLAGVAFVLSFPAPSLWPLAPVAPALTAWAAWSAPSRRVLLLAVVLGWGMAWAWLNWWIGEVSALGMPALVLYLTGWSVLHAVVLRRIARSRRGRHLPFALILPVTWVGLETLRADFLFDGYPWYLVAHPVVEAPILAQSADLLGVPLVGLLVTTVGGALVDATLRGRLTLARRRTAAGVVALAVVADVAYGGHRLRESEGLSAGPSVLAVQTNLPTSNKVAWSPHQQVRDFDAFRRLTLEAVAAERRAGRTPDLVVWPETMLPGFGLEPETLQMLIEGGWYPGDGFARAIADLAERLETPLLVGSHAFQGLRAEGERLAWERQFNSAYLLVPGTPIQRYDKAFLTPFGETMPYISNVPALEEALLDLGARGMTFDLDAGANPQPLWAPTAQGARRVATPICFEATVPWLCRRLANGGAAMDVAGPAPEPAAGAEAPPGRRGRADLFVNLSNDGWFATDDGGRLQHAQIARWRCIENRLPMVRCVNTGVSTAFDSSGRIVGTVGEGPYGTPRRTGWLLAAPPLDGRVPLYSQVGDLVGWIAMALTGVGLLASIGGSPAPAAHIGSGPNPRQPGREQGGRAATPRRPSPRPSTGPDR